MLNNCELAFQHRVNSVLNPSFGFIFPFIIMASQRGFEREARRMRMWRMWKCSEGEGDERRRLRWSDTLHGCTSCSFVKVESVRMFPPSDWRFIAGAMAGRRALEADSQVVTPLQRLRNMRFDPYGARTHPESSLLHPRALCAKTASSCFASVPPPPPSHLFLPPHLLSHHSSIPRPPHLSSSPLKVPCR